MPKKAINPTETKVLQVKIEGKIFEMIAMVNPDEGFTLVPTRLVNVKNWIKTKAGHPFECLTNTENDFDRDIYAEFYRSFIKSRHKVIDYNAYDKRVCRILHKYGVGNAGSATPEMCVFSN